MSLSWITLYSTGPENALTNPKNRAKSLSQVLQSSFIFYANYNYLPATRYADYLIYSRCFLFSFVVFLYCVSSVCTSFFNRCSRDEMDGSIQPTLDTKRLDVMQHIRIFVRSWLIQIIELFLRVCIVHKLLCTLWRHPSRNEFLEFAFYL